MTSPFLKKMEEVVKYGRTNEKELQALVDEGDD